MSELRIFDVCREGTHVLGPGSRYVIWTQGCEKRCPCCLTPESWDKEKGFVIDPIALASDIILSKHIDGITISGGEPFLQADSLSEVLEIVKALRPELTVIVYSGYTFEELKLNTNWCHLRDWSDVWIDGPYVQELNDGIGLMGSNNQSIITLTNRLDPYVDIMRNGERKIQHIINADGTFTKIGVPHNKKRNTYE